MNPTTPADRPIENETATAARKRGVDVPDDVPDDAVWARQHINSETYPAPVWIWFTARPYDYDMRNILWDVLPGAPKPT